MTEYDEKWDSHGVLTWIFIIVMIIFFTYSYSFTGAGSYELINNKSSNTSEPQKLTQDNISYIDEVYRFYPHFTNLTITFSMKGINHSEKRKRMYNALEILEEQVGEFNFIEIDNYANADIKINFPLGNNLRTLGEAKPILDYKGNIEGGEIDMINIEDEGCEDYPDTEIHEILHVFMFDHNPKTIMKEYVGGCQPLHSEWSIEYVEHLKFVYSSGERGVEYPELPYMITIFYCSDGWYNAIGPYEWCCPEPDMYADSDGYCS